MKEGENVTDQFLRFDESCMPMQAIGSVFDLNEKRVILLRIVADDFDHVVKIM